MTRRAAQTPPRGEERYTLTPRGEAYLLARDLAAPVEARRGEASAASMRQPGELADLLDDAATKLPGAEMLRAFARDLRGTFPRGPVAMALTFGATLAIAAKVLEASAETLREGAVDDDLSSVALRLVSKQLREVPSLVASTARALSRVSRTAGDDAS